MRTDLKELTIENIEEIKHFFSAVFTKEPWNDDWSDEKQLHAYILDLIGNRNSLTLGFYQDEKMVGLSMGHVKHWYEGTEYFVDELCIQTEKQGQGLGTLFIKSMEDFLLEREIHLLFLLTERTVPAYQFYRKNGFMELKENVAFAKKF